MYTNWSIYQNHHQKITKRLPLFVVSTMFYWDEKLQKAMYGDTSLCFAEAGVNETKKPPSNKKNDKSETRQNEKTSIATNAEEETVLPPEIIDHIGKFIGGKDTERYHQVFPFSRTSNEYFITVSKELKSGDDYNKKEERALLDNIETYLKDRQGYNGNVKFGECEIFYNTYVSDDFTRITKFHLQHKIIGLVLKYWPNIRSLQIDITISPDSYLVFHTVTQFKQLQTLVITGSIPEILPEMSILWPKLTYLRLHPTFFVEFGDGLLYIERFTRLTHAIIDNIEFDPFDPDNSARQAVNFVCALIMSPNMKIVQVGSLRIISLATVHTQEIIQALNINTNVVLTTSNFFERESDTIPVFSRWVDDRYIPKPDSSTIYGATQPEAPEFQGVKSKRNIYFIRQHQCSGELHPFYMSKGVSNKINFPDTLFPNALGRVMFNGTILKCAPEGKWMNTLLSQAINKTVSITSKNTRTAKDISDLLLQGSYDKGVIERFIKTIEEQPSNLGTIKTISCQDRSILFSLNEEAPKGFTDIFEQKDGLFSVDIFDENGFGNLGKRKVTLYTEMLKDKHTIGTEDHQLWEVEIHLGHIPVAGIALLNKFCHWRDVQLSACTAPPSSAWNHRFKHLRNKVLSEDYNPDRNKFVLREEPLRIVTWEPEPQPT